MKLRLVKFFTSRENEIEKKEEEEGAGSPSRAPSPSQPATIAPLLLSPSPFIISFSLPPPSPANLPPPSPQLVGRHVPENSCSSYPSPSCSASPFLLHKITETAERGEKDRGGRPACRSSCNRARPARRPLPLHQIGWLPSGFRLQVRSLRSDWSHRKTKTENEVSCFVSFIDE